VKALVVSLTNIGDAVLTTKFLRRNTAIGLLQNFDDLFFREPFAFHAALLLSSLTPGDSHFNWH